jgi:hypothetical protein
MPASQFSRLTLSIMMVAIIACATLAQSGKRLVVDNPYKDIVWTGEGASPAWQRHKANFHTHTTQSDGSLTPQAVIDQYYNNGYTILALTDHNNCTWPWTAWGRDPGSLGMVAVPGNEFSSAHHIGSWFNTIDGSPGSNIGVSLGRVADSGGLAIFHHPGRYSYATSWYTAYYQNYSILCGLEVFNQGNRYSGDRIIWDNILAELMPGQPVWGYSNDDMHSSGHLFGNYNILFVDSLTEASVRAALREGRSYLCYEPGRTGTARAPVIDSVIVDTLSTDITVHAAGYSQVQWIRGGSPIDTGITVTCTEHFTESSIAMYIRARLIGTYGETHTQPFGIRFVDTSQVAVAAKGPAAGPEMLIRHNGRGLTFDADRNTPYSIILLDIRGRRIAAVSGSGTRHLMTRHLPAGCYVLGGRIGGRPFAQTVILNGAGVWAKRIHAAK